VESSLEKEIRLDSGLQTATKESKLKVSIGSGAVLVDGFIRVDIDPATRPDRIMDARKLEFEPGTVDTIYASHVLEHFLFEGKDNKSVRWSGIVSLLKSWRECLTPDGCLYICVPDLEQLSKILEEFREDEDIQKTVLDTIFGGSRNSYDIHFSGFTRKVMTQLLKQAGFGEVKPFESFVKDESSHRIAGKPISLNLVASNSASQSQVEFQEVNQVTQEDELEKYIRVAEERRLEILTLTKACNERLDLINKLHGEIIVLKRFQEDHKNCGLWKKQLKGTVKKIIGRN